MGVSGGQAPRSRGPPAWPERERERHGGGERERHGVGERETWWG